MGIEAKTNNYWIAPNAVNITLNALGDENRIYGSVASGSIISCYIESVKPESAGPEYEGNGDGLGLDNGRNPKRWQLVISPTYFNSDTVKYVYAAIPRKASFGTQAIVVFPSERIDIYGKNDGGEQIGSIDYFYVWLRGIISAPANNQRTWTQAITWGSLGTYEDIIDMSETDWYSFSKVTETVTFLKKIVMKAGSYFQNIFLSEKELTGVATAATDEEFIDSDTLVATPNYINQHYLRKDADDEATGNIGFLEGIWIGIKDKYYITKAGIASLYQLFADSIITRFIQVEDMKSANYSGDGMADTGWSLSNHHNGHSKLTIDELYVRMKAVFESLEVRERTYTGGDQIWSCAGNYISRTDYMGNAVNPETGEDVTDDLYEDGTSYDGTKDMPHSSVPRPGDTYGYSMVEVPWMLRSAAMILGRNNGLVSGLYSRYAKVRIVIPDEEEMPAATRGVRSVTPVINQIRRVRCYFLAKDDDREVHNWWRINDLARCQTMNLSNTNRQTYIGGRQSKAGNVFWWRKVIYISTEPVQLDDGKWYHYFDVAFNNVIEESDDDSSRATMATFAMAGSDIPAATDSVVQFGNTINAGRMNLMMMEVNGGDAEVGYAPSGDAPCLKAYRGIYCFDLNKCWVGGKCCKMKLSPSTGYEFYGPNFKQVTEYDVVPVPVDRGLWTDICRKKNAAGAYIDEWEFNADDYARTEVTPYSDDETTLRDYSSYVDGQGHVAVGAPVRKCYYYDKVSHRGCYWLCSIVDGSHWVQPVEVSGVTEWQYITDAAYAALSLEQQALCERRQNYTIDEPSETSQDWTLMVARGTMGETPAMLFKEVVHGTTPTAPDSAIYTADRYMAADVDSSDDSSDDSSGDDWNWTWSKTAPNRRDGYDIWMSQNTILTTDANTYLLKNQLWSTPTRISGDQGDPGEDAPDREWIYIGDTEYRSTYTDSTHTHPKDISTDNDGVQRTSEYIHSHDDFVPQGWSDNAIATDDDQNKFVYASWRDKPKGSNTWGDFNNPILWSNWGVQGIDGDGVQYIYKLFNHELTDDTEEGGVVTPGERTTNIPTNATQNADGEWMPTPTIPAGVNNGWSDNPLSPTVSMQYCYCSVIKKLNGEWEMNGIYGAFGKLGLWSRFSEDGQGAYKSVMFVRLNTTPTKPANNKGSYANPSPSDCPAGTSGGSTVYWSDGIPAGEAQVWATSRIFTSDGQSPQQPVWSTPQPMSDTDTFDVEFAKKQTGDATPATPCDDDLTAVPPVYGNRHGGSGTQIWFDPTLDSSEDFTQMYWRAERECKNGVWGDWTIIRIKGEKGDPGDGQPEYIQTQEAWSNDATTTNVYTAPTTEHGRTDGTSSHAAEVDWHDTTPANTNDYAYLWRRSRKMVLQSDGTYLPETNQGVLTDDGKWSYARLSGTNGTSISVKGTVATVADLSNISNPQDGDAYVVSANGHLYMWSSEANDWIDLGVFKGDPGTTYYTHIAWASAVTIGTTPSGHTTTGQTTTPNATSVTGFSIAPFTGAAWMGVLINTVASDSNDGLAYTWNKVEGPQGPQGGKTATIYLYKRSATAVSTVGIASTLYYKFSTKKLYTNSACTTEATTQLSGWSLDIPTGTDPIYVTAAIAYSETESDDIGSNEWVTPALFTGEHGINSATVFLYKRAASAPTGTAASPQQTLYYNFADGELYKLSGTTYQILSEDATELNGWKLKIPETNGNPCYVIQAAALSTELYDAIEVVPAQSKNDWSSVRKMVEDGEEGNGISTITRTYARCSVGTASETQGPDAAYIDTTIGTNGWCADSPATTEDYQYLWAREVITYTKQGVSDTIRYYCIGKKGDNGIDAQDVEWVFIRTKTNIPPVIDDDSTYTDSNNKTYTSDDHLPKVVPGTGGSASDIEGDNSGNVSKPYECTDDPQGVDGTWKYEWEIKRTKGAAVNGRRTWNYYTGTMTLHNNYAESAFIIDLDNDNDQFGTDSDGKVLVSQTRSTTVTVFDGATPQTLASLSVTMEYEDGTSVPNTVATYSANASTGVVSVTVLQNTTTAFTHEAIKATITASVTGKGSKSAVFTIRKVMSGQPGISPTIYQLNPTSKDFVFNRDASNNLTPSSRSTTVNALKTVGNTTTAATSADNLTFAWGFDESGTAQESGKAIGSTVSVTSTQAASHYQVWVQLSTGDRESLPIVRDGAKGAKGDDGDDGNGIVSITRTFAISSVGTTASETAEPSHQGSWTANSPAVTEQYPYLWAKEVVVFTDTTMNTTKYYCIGARGDNGVDAQDIEWVYIRTKTNTAPVILNDSAYTDTNGKTYTSDDHLPQVSGNINIENNESKYQCTDDPKGVNDTWKYEWEIKRTKGASVNGHRTWDYYSGTMTLHNNYAESAFIIDTDNDNDQFGTDSEGKVLISQTRSTTVTMFDGATPQTLASLNATMEYEDGTSVPNTVATYSANASTGVVSVTVLQNTTTAFTHEAIKATITASVTGKGSKSAVFTIRKVMSGQPGLSPTIYQLNPTSKDFVFNRDASNNLTPSSRSTTVNAMKTIGNTTTDVTSAGNLSFTWGFDESATVEGNGTVGDSTGNPPHNQISVSNTQAASHYQVWVELSTGDRETLPIVKDGSSGQDMRENIIDHSEPKFTFNVPSAMDSQGRCYSTTDKTYVPAKMPADGRKVSGQARVTLTGCSFNGTGKIVLYSAARTDHDVGYVYLINQEVTSEMAAGGTFDIKYENKTVNSNSGAWTGAVRLQLTNFVAGQGTVTVERVKLEEGEKCSDWCLSENDKKGSGGTSPYFADLDNEMDSIACDTDGHPVQISSSDQSVSTVLSLWHGTTEIAVATPTVKRNGMSITLGTKTSGVTVSWNSTTKTLTVTYDGASNTQAVINGKDEYEITLTASDDNTIARKLTFTVNGVRPGENGQPATIYSLVPSQSHINVGRTAAGGYNPSTFTLTCGYAKNVGGVMTTVADVTGQIDNTYNIYHRKRNRSSGTWTAFYLYSQYKTDSDAIHTLANFSVANYDAVEFVLCTNTGRKIDGTTNPSEPQNVIDRETVPVVSDGENGSNGKNAIHMDIDNEYDSIQYQGDGVTKVSPSATVQTTAYLFDGVTDKSSDATFTISNRSGMTNEQATISGRVVTVSGLNSDGEVTIRAEYPASSGKYYYAKFTVKKLIGTDKYDLVVTPNAVGVNTSNTVADTAISVQVYRTPANGGTRHLVQFTKVSGAYTNSYGLTLSVIDSLSNALAETTTGSEATTRTFNLTGSMATSADNVFVTLTKDSKTQDAETIPITHVHNGINGSGANAVKIDLDNEMDSIPCDSDGKVMSQTVLQVNARIYDGASPVRSGVAVSSVGAIAGESAVTSISNGVVNIKWTIPATGSGTPLSVDKFTSQIVLTWGGNSYYATFTANVVKSGEPGVTPTIFQLVPSPTQISFKRNSSGVIPSSTQTLSLSIKKSDGNGQSLITVNESGLTVRYRTSQFPSSPTDGREWPSAGLPVSSSATYGNVYIAAFDSSGTLVDRETVAIVKDGENGAAGASNSYITVKGGCARTVEGEQEPVQVDGSVTIFDGRATTVINVSDIETSWGTNQRRGFALVAIDRQTLEYEYYSRFYDVTDATYGSYLLGGLVDNIAVYSEGGYFVCLFSQDSVAWSNDLVEALKGLGGTGVANTATGRYPFAFIGQGGLEQGHARQNQGTLEQATAVEVTAYFADGNLITSKDGEPGEDAWIFTAEPANVIITQNMVTTTNFSSATISFSAKKGSANATITSIGTPTWHHFTGSADGTAKTVTVTAPTSNNGAYYTEGYFKVMVNATAPDGSTSSKEVTVLCYANLMGTFKTTIEGDVETSVAQSLEYAINGTEVNSFTNVGTYIRSSKEKTDAVAETVTTLTTANPANMFGFTKGIKFNSEHRVVLPFIQDYGFEVCNSYNNYRVGRIQNIGFNGIEGFYVLTCEMKVSGVSEGEKFDVKLCVQNPARVISGLDANGKYTPSTSEWTKVCAVYELTKAKLSTNFDSYMSGSNNGYNGFMDVKSDTASTSTHVFIRCLQIERASVPSSTFGICDADDKYASQHDHEYVENTSNVALDDTAKWTADPASGGFAPSGSTWNNMAVYQNSVPLTSSNGTVSGDYRIMELSASNLQVTTKTPYTLSFWAKASAAAKMRCALSCGNTDGSVYEESSALENNQSASTATSGLTKITLGTTWKKYYVHFYAESTVSNATAVGIRISTEDSLPSNCTFSVCGLKLEKGYITSYERTDYKTVIQQTSRSIDMSVLVNSVKKAGIELTTNQEGDVTTGVINATADNFIIKNSSGTQTFYIDEHGNIVGVGDASFSGNLNAAGGTFSGTLNAADGTFTGTLSGVTGTFAGTLTSTNDFLQLTTSRSEAGAYTWRGLVVMGREEGMISLGDIATFGARIGDDVSAGRIALAKRVVTRSGGTATVTTTVPITLDADDGSIEATTIEADEATLHSGLGIINGVVRGLKLRVSIVNSGSEHTPTLSEGVIIINTGIDEDFQLKLPTPSANYTGKFYFIKNKSNRTGGDCIITVDDPVGGHNYLLDNNGNDDYSRNLDHDSLVVCCDGEHWIMFGSHFD